jgi:ABC-2 type transport system permease protein
MSGGTAGLGHPLAASPAAVAARGAGALAGARRRSQATAVADAAGTAGWAARDMAVLAKRTLCRMITTPEQVLNVTAQPIIIVLLFSYVFGGSITLPGHGSYREYLIGGIFAVTMCGTAQGTGIGLAIDISGGLIDRFRSLPMSRAAVLAGRTLADLALTIVAAAVTAGTGLLLGWRIHTGPADTIAALGLALLFAYAASWGGACVGMLARSAESAQTVGLLVILPLSLTSNAFISTARLTPWLRTVADWNPVSVLATACRQLLGNPDPSAAIRSWPMQHAVLASALWSAVLLAALVPLAVFLYARRVQR